MEDKLYEAKISANRLISKGNTVFCSRYPTNIREVLKIGVNHFIVKLYFHNPIPIDLEIPYNLIILSKMRRIKLIILLHHTLR